MRIRRGSTSAQDAVFSTAMKQLQPQQVERPERVPAARRTPRPCRRHDPGRAAAANTRPPRPAGPGRCAATRPGPAGRRRHRGRVPPSPTSSRRHQTAPRSSDAGRPASARCAARRGSTAGCPGRPSPAAAPAASSTWNGRSWIAPAAISTLTAGPSGAGRQPRCPPARRPAWAAFGGARRARCGSRPSRRPGGTRRCRRRRTSTPGPGRRPRRHTGRPSRTAVVATPRPRAHGATE